MKTFVAVCIFLCILMVGNYACPGVEIVSRSSWGARFPTIITTIKRPVEHVIIGHTLTPECHIRKTCIARMNSMQNFHMSNALGWGDIGYNFVIGGDGRVYEGVGWNRVGVHTYGWNLKSYGIAFVGNFMNTTPDDDMVKAAKALIICGIKEGHIARNREIHGARDATCTDSPGTRLYEIIRKWPSFKGGPLDGYTC